MSVRGRLRSGRERKKGAVIPLDFGNALKAARDEKFSTTEVGWMIGKSDAIISMYEGGLQLPPETTMEALENKLEASLRPAWEKVKPAWEEFKRRRKEGRTKERPVQPSPSLRQRLPSGFLTTQQINSMTAKELGSFIRLQKKLLGRAEAILAKKRGR